MTSNCQTIFVTAVGQLLHFLASSAPGDLSYNGKLFSNVSCCKNSILEVAGTFKTCEICSVFILHYTHVLHDGVTFVMQS
jgi:hypothetical protein